MNYARQQARLDWKWSSNYANKQRLKVKTDAALHASVCSLVKCSCFRPIDLSEKVFYSYNGVL